MKRFRVGGPLICSISCQELATLCEDDYSNMSENGCTKVVFSMNGQGISQYNLSSKFRSLVDEADLVHPDGMSTVWGWTVIF